MCKARVGLELVARHVECLMRTLPTVSDPHFKRNCCVSLTCVCGCVCGVWVCVCVCAWEGVEGMNHIIGSIIIIMFPA